MIFFSLSCRWSVIQIERLNFPQPSIWPFFVHIHVHVLSYWQLAAAMDSSTIHVARGNVEAWHGLILTPTIISDPHWYFRYEMWSSCGKDGFCNNCFPLHLLIHLSFFTSFVAFARPPAAHPRAVPPTPFRSVPFQELPAKPSESDEVWDGGPIG